VYTSENEVKTCLKFESLSTLSPSPLGLGRKAVLCFKRIHEAL
jgi:hypothetical protein